ncbi:MAG: asparagine synthase-domain-containing protein [Benniella sp.]|nr:MAG: asparagine synthase-domain-containing protein [Benniella sp.]
MCGILFRIQDQRSESHKDTWSTLVQLNAKRGPSAQDTYCTTISLNDAQGSDETHVELAFYGAVLHLRGDTVTRQPHVSTTGNVLLWNGEIFDGVAVDHHQNDGRVLMDHLEDIALQSSGQAHLNLLLEIMARIEGPYAFVYFHASSRTIYFGRDCLGRRSLLWHKKASQEDGVEPPFILTSVGYSSFQGSLLALDEVPADGIYSLVLGSNGMSMITKHPWIRSTVDEQGGSSDISLGMPLPFGMVNDCIPTDDQLPEPFPENVKYDQAHPEIVPRITEDMKKAITDTIAVLGDSVHRRVQDIPRTGLPHEARVAILFSGGLDCSCLAALADRYLPQGEAIDLLNVGFENPRSVKAKAAEEALALKRLKKQGAGSVDGSTSQSARTVDSTFNVPDRVTGYESLAELRRIAPHRHWNFVEVNVPFEEANARRSEILERMAPLDTVMDLSIAMAFWFASRGIGYLKNEKGELEPYTSQAKVLLSGLGADEQLGGYSRHKEQFKATGWKGLIQELQLDLDRISTRNLGRDDRIISDHGKEARYPFLSTHVVQFLSGLRVDLKVDLRYPRGVGEKILLRHVARELGFVRAGTHWKRAVQFGARTAKMTEGGRSEVGQQVIDRSQ